MCLNTKGAEASLPKLLSVLRVNEPEPELHLLAVPPSNGIRLPSALLG